MTKKNGSKRKHLVLLAATLILVLTLPFFAPVMNLFRAHDIPLGFFAVSTVLPFLCAGTALMISRTHAPVARDAVRHEHVDFLPSFACVSGFAGLQVMFGFTSAIYALGHDGLIFGLAMTAALPIFLLLNESLTTSSSWTSVTGFVHNRFQIRGLSYFVYACVLAIAVLFLAVALVFAMALLKAAGVVDRHLGLMGLIACCVACALLPSETIQRRLLPFAGVLIFVCLTTVIFSLGFVDYGFIAPHVQYGQLLDDVSKLEQASLLAGLADPVVFKRFARPEIHFGSGNFIALTASFILGSLFLLSSVRTPHLDHGKGAGGSHVVSRPSLRWAPTVLAFLFVTAVVISTMAKHVVFKDVVGAPVTTAAELSEESAIKVLQICGESTDVTLDVVARCKTRDEPEKPIRAHDLTVSDGQALAMLLSLKRTPRWLWFIFFGGAFASLLAAVLFARVIVYENIFVLIEREKQPKNIYAPLGWIFVVASAALLAVCTSASGQVLWSGVLTLGAAVIVPALVIPLFWQRMPAYILSMCLVVSIVTAGVYWIGSVFFPVQFFQITAALSNAGPYAIEDFYDLLASWQAQSPTASTVSWNEIENAARPLANWWGAAPATAGLIGNVAALLVMIPLALVHRVFKVLNGMRGNASR